MTRTGRLRAGTAVLIAGAVVSLGVAAAAAALAAAWLAAIAAVLLAVSIVVSAILVGPPLREIMRALRRIGADGPVELERLSRELRQIETAVKKTDATSAEVQRRVTVTHNTSIRRQERWQRDLYRQVEALHSIYRTLDLEHGLPPMRAWAVSPDLAAHLLRHVRIHKPGVIVEAGSGVSTLLLALSAERAGRGEIIAFEHDEHFALETEKLLEEYGVRHRERVLVAPLVTTRVGAADYPWYDTSRFSIDEPIGLLLVDGPPGSIGPQSRYPAVPVLAPNIDENTVVLLDDGKREEEVAIAERWCAEDGMTVTGRLPHEKGTIELRRAGGRANQTG